MNGVELTIWLQREHYPICCRCLENSAVFIMPEDFDCWLGSAKKGTRLCRDCAEKIGYIDHVLDIISASL